MARFESMAEFLSLMQQQHSLVVAFCTGSVRHSKLHIVTMVQFPVALTNRSGLYVVVVALAVVDEQH